MKKLFNIELNCPFCGNKISYSIISMNAKHECEHCENELIVRVKPIVSVLVSIIGLLIVFLLASIFDITQFNKFVRLIIVFTVCLIYIVIAYRLLCLILGANKVYAVDAQDPTLLKHNKKIKK